MKSNNKSIISFDINDITTFINILKTFSKIVNETPWIFDIDKGIIIQCVADNKTSYATLTIHKKYINNFVYNHSKDKYYINVNFENLLNLLAFTSNADLISLFILEKNPNILNIKVLKNNINTKNLKLNLNAIDNVKSFNKDLKYDYKITNRDSVKFNKYLKDMEKISPYISFTCSDNEFITECIGDNNSQVTINFSNNSDTSDNVKIQPMTENIKPFKNYYQISDITQYSNCSTCSNDIRLFLKNNEILKIIYQIYNFNDKSKKIIKNTKIINHDSDNSDNINDNNDNDNNDNNDNEPLNKFATLKILITNIDPSHFNQLNNDNDNDNSDNLSEYSDSD
jgi:hypothetical protein